MSTNFLRFEFLMTVSQPENNCGGFGALHKTSHTDVLRRSRAVNDEAKYKQA